MSRRAVTMRATRIATGRDHKQEASFPQAVFLFPEMDEKATENHNFSFSKNNFLDCKFNASIIQRAILSER